MSSRLAGAARPLVLLVLASLALLLSGCLSLPDSETEQIHATTQITLLEPGRSAGQSFVARRSGLDAIQLRMSPAADGLNTSSVSLAIYNLPGDAQPLRTATVPLSALSADGWTEFRFKPLDVPPNQPLYLEITINSAAVLVMGRDEDANAHGSAHLDRHATAVDLAFKTSYAYNRIEWVLDLQAVFSNSWLLLPLLLALWLPGWLLLPPARPEDDPAERFALANGLSLAIVPVALAWTSLAGLHWNKVAVLLVAGFLLALAIRRMWITRPARFADYRPPAHVFALLAVTLFSLAVRLVMVRDVAFPAWVDSVHHGVITRLLMQLGAYPTSYAPLIDISSASYHSGYHANLALFTWLSGMPLEQAMLLHGQVLNALYVPTIYLLARRLGANRAGGIFSGLLVGLFSPMPAYYTSWGRYTQLAGLLILPATFMLIQQTLATPSRRSVWLAGLAGAGIFLIHYRTAAFLAVLLSSVWLVQGLSNLGSKPAFNQAARKVSQWAARLVGAIAIGLLLDIPWLPTAVSSLFVPMLQQWAGSTPKLFDGFALSFLTTAWGRPAIVLAGLGIGWSLARLPRLAISILLWVAGMLLLANLQPLGLPGSGFITNLSVAISLFLPICVAGGYFLGNIFSEMHHRVPTRFNIAFALITTIVTATTALFAARALIPILNQGTLIARAADRQAIAWMDANLPSGETVFINTAGWGYGLYQGIDGGYWIAPLTGHPTLPPPALYGLDADLERGTAITQKIKDLFDTSSDPARLHALLLNAGVRYVYVGVRGGPLSPRKMLESGLFKTSYNALGAWVLQALTP